MSARKSIVAIIQILTLLVVAGLTVARPAALASAHHVGISCAAALSPSDA